MNKNKLSTSDISKLISLTRISRKSIMELARMNLINIQEARAIIIKSDYQKKVSSGKENKSGIIKKLAESYNLSVSSIEKIIYRKE